MMIGIKFMYTIIIVLIQYENARFYSISKYLGLFHRYSSLHASMKHFNALDIAALAGAKHNDEIQIKIAL